MSIISFRYSIKKDAENWISRIYGRKPVFVSEDWLFSKYPPELLKRIKEARNRKNALSLVEDYLKNDSLNQEKIAIIKEEIKAIRKVWKSRESAFFETLKRIDPRLIAPKKLTAYFTTFFICPYSEKGNWFMVNFWASLPQQITEIAHEILHLQFLHNYREYLENSRLEENQIQLLKEALTFLLNEKGFYKVIIKPDIGYSEHKIIRQELKNAWDETKNFDSFLTQAIEIIKKKTP